MVVNKSFNNLFLVTSSRKFFVITCTKINRLTEILGIAMNQDLKIVKLIATVIKASLIPVS